MIEENNKYPLVSVVVPIYNMELFLAETINSILASDYPNFEVILYDDGSADNSYLIAQEFADAHNNVRLFTHKNSGVSVTRNKAIDEANGLYILPVDADNTIAVNFISAAVQLIEGDEEIVLVIPRSDFIGEKSGEWKLPKYSLQLLGRKNIIDNCALYRKADWARVGGYCADIVTREDWDFWLSLLGDGGKVVQLPFIAHHYRVRSNSKRVTNRKLKSKVIDRVNERHIELFVRLFNGPLRQQRTWSKLINVCDNIFNHRRAVVAQAYDDISEQIKLVHWRMQGNWGSVMHKGRNELREVEISSKTYIVKSYAVPNIINRFAYGFLRKSKAQRAFENAQKFLAAGVDTPKSVAYITRRLGFLLLKESYFISEKSEYMITFNDIINNIDLPQRADYLSFVGEQTAKMHSAGLYPLDFSGGNILLDCYEGKLVWQVVDLNRMRFSEVDLDRGCRGFERLNLEPAALEIMAKAYAEKRGFDAEECVKLVKQYRWKKHL